MRFFAIKRTAAKNKTIILCLELIQFGMSSTLISFNREYYKYHGGKKEQQRLAIGGYESAFLANLVAPYLIEKYKTLINRKTCHGIYQDDGLVVFKGKTSMQEIKIC